MVLIGIIGEVSVGKSTLLNALVSKYLSSTSLKRTTYVPFLFKNETCDNEDSQDYIEKTIQVSNENKEHVSELINFKTNISFTEDKNFSLIDFAGVNDGAETNSTMENVFFKHIDKLDYIIYVTNSNSSMTLKSERDFFIKLVNNIKTIQSKGSIIQLIVIFNKYDDETENDSSDNDELSEVDEIINESLDFMNEKIEFKYFKISAQKMMVKNIITKDKTAIQNIPHTIVHKILSEYHGKKKAKQILKNKKIKTSDINEIELSKYENKFLKYLNKIADTNNYITDIKQFIKDKLNPVTTYTELIATFNKYNKYASFKDISILFDSCYQKILNLMNSSSYKTFTDFDNYIYLNNNTKLDKQQIYETIYSKYIVYNNNYTETTQLFNKFLSDKLNNFMFLKDKNDKTLIYTFLNCISLSNDINNYNETLKKLHNDTSLLSSVINIKVMNTICIKTNIDWLITINPYFNYTLCDFFNNYDKINTTYDLKLQDCKYYTKNIYSSKSIPDNTNKILYEQCLEYKPLYLDFEFIKDKFQYYPAKTVQYLTFMHNIDLSTINNSVKSPTIINTKGKKEKTGKKHNIEIVDSDDDLFNL